VARLEYEIDFPNMEEGSSLQRYKYEGMNLTDSTRGKSS
jgi:hypothetical protein